MYESSICYLYLKKFVLENPSAAKVKRHTAYGYSLFMHCSFNIKKDKCNYYKGKDCMKNLCKDLTKTFNESNLFQKTKNVTIKGKSKPILL